MPENTSFKLKSMADIFAPTDPERKPKGSPVFDLALDKLHPFKSHPFKLYTGQRLDDMVESVKANGVIVPIIVRPIDDFNYEILSGHNRVEAAKVAGLETVPSIIRENLTDEEALLIVTETNLLQRSFADLSHSERALTLSMHHEAIKKQGRRTDLIQEIENMVNASNINGFETCSPMANKSKSLAKVGDQYDLSKDTVARYLRIHKLIQPHKERLDDGDLPMRAAVSLSYLPADEQQIVDDILDASHYKADMKKAEALRAVSEKRPLDHETAEQILAGTKKPRSAKPPAFKLKPRIISRYFTLEQKPEDIEATIIAALEFYRAHLKGGAVPNGEAISADDPAGEALPSEGDLG